MEARYSSRSDRVLHPQARNEGDTRARHTVRRHLPTVYEDYIGYFCPSKRIGKYIIRRLSNRYYNPANALVVPSDKLRKTEQGYKVSCPITVIPTGIELDRFSRRISHEEKEQLLAKYGLTPGKTLVSVCRLAAERTSTR